MIAYIKANSSSQINWPINCVICAKQIKLKHENRPSYCSDCQAKVDRLQKWKDSAFMISLPFGVIGLIITLIAAIKGQGFNTFIIIIAVTSGLFFTGIVYALIRLLQLPLELFFHSKFFGPGFKYLKSKEPNTLKLKFNNEEYAKKFKQING